MSRSASPVPAKLPYERELPTELLTALMRARVEEYEATGAGWYDR